MKAASAALGMMSTRCITTEPVYLDYAGACPILPKVLAVHDGLCRTYIANPHATTRASHEAKQAVWRAEQELLGLLDIPAEQARVIWTAGGTEADNLATLGLLRRAPHALAVVDAGAHPALLEPCRHFAETESGALLKIPLNKQGKLALEQIGGDEAADAACVAINLVNNETGATADLHAVRNWMNAANPHAKLVVDAMQAVGKINIPWRDADIDILTLSARKIGGPAAVGAVILRRGIDLAPLLYGGGQQNGLRPGTLDTVGVLEAVLAVRHACEHKEAETARLMKLNQTLKMELKHAISQQIRILSPDSAVPGILSIALPGYEGAVIVRLLADHGVIIGTGSACSAESKEPSHILSAMGLPRELARGALRISMGWGTVEDHIKTFVAELKSVLAHY